MFARVPARALLAATLAALLLAAVDAMAERIPATFDHDEAALAAGIELPELRGDAEATLRCAARVTDSGKLKDNGCYIEQPSDEAFIPGINKAAKKARMNPARIDGKSREVYVQYRVRLKRTGEDETVVIYNNPGLLENIEAYGEEHIAAQRTFTDEAWQQECPRRTRFLVWAKAHVAETGEQSSISLLPGNGPPITERCREAIVATLQKSQFTPAYADGEPVPSSFIEPFGN